MAKSAVATQPQSRRGVKYRGKPVAELRADRRQRLLDTALELFAAQGYAATTINQICAAASVSPRYFYEHFESREQLLRAVYDHIVETGRSAVACAVARESDPLKIAPAAIEAFVHYYLGDVRRAKVGNIEVVGVSPEVERRRREVVNEFAELILGIRAHMVAAGVLQPGDFRSAAVGLVGATNEIIVDWISEPAGRSADQVADEIVRFYRTQITGAQRGPTQN